MTTPDRLCFIPFPGPVPGKKFGAWVAQLVEHMTENHGVGGSIPPPGTTFPPAVDTGALFRTHVTFPNTASRARLDVLGVVVLDEGPDWALVLADAGQLEALARLRFAPRASDDLDLLVGAHAQAKPWLARELQPLLARAADVRDLSPAGVSLSGADASTLALAEAEADLQVTLPEEASDAVLDAALEAKA